MPIYSPGHVVTADEFNAMMPVGTVLPFAGSAAPTGWLPCDGSAVSRATYSDLFSVIGTTYGAGDGSTTFNVPDTRGRAIVHKAGSGTFNTLGGKGGEETHTLTSAEMPSHTHNVTAAGTINAVSAGTPAGTINSVSAGTPAGSVTVNSGGAHTHTISGTTGGGGLVTDNVLHNTTNGLAGYSFPFGADSGGSHSHTASFAGSALAGHSHTFSGSAMGTHSHTFTGSAVSSTSTGTGGAHNNLQPYMVLLGIIRY